MQVEWGCGVFAAGVGCNEGGLYGVVRSEGVTAVFNDGVFAGSEVEETSCAAYAC